MQEWGHWGGVDGGSSETAVRSTLCVLSQCRESLLNRTPVYSVCSVASLVADRLPRDEVACAERPSSLRISSATFNTRERLQTAQRADLTIFARRILRLVSNVLHRILQPNPPHTSSWSEFYRYLNQMRRKIRP